MPGKRATRAQRRRHEEAAEWLLRNGETGQTVAERAAFQSWLERDPENRRTYDAASRLMGEASSAIRSDPSLQRVELRSPRSGRILAGCLLAIGLAGVLFLALDGPMRLRADAMSGAGEMPFLTLADGSLVQLDASSAIAYENSDDRRTVRLLRGRAFFDVARDPDRPFTVEAGGARVTALGTAFAVSLGDTETDVAVAKHAVLIEWAEAAYPSLRVSEGEQAVVDDRAGATRVTPDAALALAWRRGQLVVDNAPLSYVVNEMNRHFAGRIVIAGFGLADRRISGTMTVSNTDAALDFLQRALGVTVNRIGPLIVVRGG
ncbi:Uncharacterised protein [Starkeya nomas]|uniref:Protein FecR n=1 Tax=Starkeya nomas TaxID=2666134 RepID=A0A5S9Q5W7_9HYPH|nr:FecR family protein [Starkeya nomas]CAA0112597.1 Uncharacterised protein [Starkeya nomas]